MKDLCPFSKRSLMHYFDSKMCLVRVSIITPTVGCNHLGILTSFDYDKSPGNRGRAEPVGERREHGPRIAIAGSILSWQTSHSRRC